MKKKIFWLSLAVVFYAVGIGCGWAYFKYGHYYLVEKPKLAKMQEEREQVPCKSIDKSNLMVALVFGQSNSANYGETIRTSGEHVYNFHEGKCYRAKDPLLGATGIFGSVWTRLGDRLIEEQLFSDVMFVSVGVGGTEIQYWAPGGSLYPKVIDAIQQTRDAGFPVTHMFWHQGEEDSRLGTDAETYKNYFLAMLDGIREVGVYAPMFPAITTMCRRVRKSDDIQDVQRSFPTLREEVFLGPDTDELGLEYRFDGCHFSDDGLARHAELWLNVIRRYQMEKEAKKE